MVAYGEAQFDAEGKGVYLTCDKFGEFQQIAYLDLATKKITPIDLACRGISKPWSFRPMAIRLYV